MPKNSFKLRPTETKDQLLAEKAVLSQKIDGVAQYLTKGEKRAQRAKKMALDGLIEIDEYKAVLKEVEEDQKDIQKKVEHWRQQMADIDRMIEEDTLSIKKILEISDHITAMDEQEMRTIVRRWIKQITFDGVTVLSEVDFCRQFNGGKITSRKYELFMMECD